MSDAKDDGPEREGRPDAGGESAPGQRRPDESRRSDSEESEPRDTRKPEPRKETESPQPAEGGGAQAPADKGKDKDKGDMSAFEADVGADSDLAKAMDRIGKLSDQLDHVKDDLAHARADYYNLERQYGAFVRRTKEEAAGFRQSGRIDVLQALIGVLDDIDAARAHGELEAGPFASIARKLEGTLATHFQLERFGEEGEDFDPKRHEALLAETRSDVDHPVVGQVLQPGYRVGEKILRATKVKVHNPQ